jgi:hypothetical protein
VEAEIPVEVECEDQQRAVEIQIRKTDPQNKGAVFFHGDWMIVSGSISGNIA